MNRQSIISEIRKINGELFRGVNKRYKEMGLEITHMQAKVLLTIYKSDDALCQKDLELPMSCNKSTLSAVISTMEKNGLISRQVSEIDSRINNLILTDKGFEMIEFLNKDRKVTEGVLTESITDEEYITFMNIVDKIRKNLERI